MGKKKPRLKKTTKRVTAERTWIVTASSERPIAEIAKDLARAGFTVHQRLEAVGSIIGTARNDVVPRLRAIRGVAAVAPETQIDIGLPGSPETW